MQASLLPDAVRMPFGRAFQLNRWAIGAIVAAAAARWSLARISADATALRVLVALAPMVPCALYARSLAGWIRTLDELQRKIQLEAWLFAALGALLASTAAGWLSTAGVTTSGGLGWEATLALLLLLHMAGCARASRRYP